MKMNYSSDFAQSQVNGIQKDLDRALIEIRILKGLLMFRCDIRDCPLSAKRQDGWKAPDSRYDLAVSFQYSEDAAFVVYGSDLGNIREVAAFYAAQKYGSFTKLNERVEDQSQLGRVVVDPYNRRLEIVGIDPSQYTDRPDETHYVSDLALSWSLSEVKAMPDWGWFGD